MPDAKSRHGRLLSLNDRIRYHLAPLKAHQVAKRNNSNVFAQHVGRAVAHRDSARARVETVDDVRAGFIRAIEEADRRDRVATWRSRSREGRTTEIGGIHG